MTKYKNAVRNAMYQHGFTIAAELADPPLGPHQLKAWAQFPACMDRYPLTLKYRRDIEGNIIEKFIP